MTTQILIFFIQIVETKTYTYQERKCFLPLNKLMIYVKISSVVTTKVKGQGFVPVNKLLDKFSNNNVQEYKKMFEIKPDIRYKILDTAGS